MTANDLKKPLGQDKKPRFRKSQLFMLSSLALTLTLCLSLALWIALVDDPEGGYPTQVVDLTAALTQTQRIGVEGIRPGIKPGVPETNLSGLNQKPDTSPQTTDTPSGDDGEIRILDTSDPSLAKPATLSGTPPYQLYSQPVNIDAIAGLPRIAIVIDGLGLSQSTTQEALSLLPPAVTFAFAPYGGDLARWARKAHGQGHELLIQVPMEPFDYPDNDPGPHTLLTSAKAEVNKSNLNWILDRIDSYVGVMNYMGARFSSDELVGTDFMRELARNGLIYLENGASARSQLNAIAANMQVPNLRADLIIDARGRSQDIETRLVQLETIAQEQGHALGVASAFPVSIQTITEWTQTLRQRGFALVPITTLLQQ